MTTDGGLSIDLGRLLGSLSDGSGSDVGIRGWSMFAVASRQVSLGVKDRETGNPHAPLTIAESCGARYLFVWDDATISRGYLERRQLEGDPRATLKAARAAAYEDPDAAHVLGSSEIPRVETFDPQAAEEVAGNAGRLSHRLSELRRRIDDAGCRTYSGSFSASQRTARIVTSAGLDAGYEGTGYGWYVTVDGEIGSGRSARGPEPDAEFTDRVERVLDLAHRLRERGPAIEGGTLPVLLHPRVVESVVMGTLLHHLDGSTVSHDEGLFSRTQFGDGKAVLREDLTLTLDPLKPLRSGSYRFTSEGVPARHCTFIDRGRLIEPVLDVKYARRLGREPTPLPSAMDTLELTGPRRLTLGEGLARADGGALILSVLGVHTQDSASGDFSLSAPQVLRIAGGELQSRTRATISGNLFEVLRDDALTFVAFEGEHTPGLLFPCRIDSAD